MAKRRTDKEIFEGYCEAMGWPYPLKPNCAHVFGLSVVKKARKEEPRINHWAHFADWMNICDEDDDMDSFYGEDYDWDI